MAAGASVASSIRTAKRCTLFNINGIFPWTMNTFKCWMSRQHNCLYRTTKLQEQRKQMSKWVICNNKVDSSSRHEISLWISALEKFKVCMAATHPDESWQFKTTYAKEKPSCWRLSNAACVSWPYYFWERWQIHWSWTFQQHYLVWGFFLHSEKNVFFVTLP